MKRALLAKMEKIIANKIAAKKEMGENYDFMEIKRFVINMHAEELGEERDSYSSELSRRFTFRK